MHVKWWDVFTKQELALVLILLCHTCYHQGRTSASTLWIQRKGSIVEHYVTIPEFWHCNNHWRFPMKLWGFLGQGSIWMILISPWQALQEYLLFFIQMLRKFFVFWCVEQRKNRVAIFIQRLIAKSHPAALPTPLFLPTKMVLLLLPGKSLSIKITAEMTIDSGKGVYLEMWAPAWWICQKSLHEPKQKP